MLTLWETCLVHRSSSLQCFAVATQSCAAGANIIQQGSEKVVIPHELFEAKTMKELMSANIPNYKSESRTHHFPPGAPSSEPNPQCRSQCWQWPLCQSQRHARDCQGGNKENCLTLFLDFCSSLASSLSWFKRECIYLYCLYHIDFDFHVQKFQSLPLVVPALALALVFAFAFGFFERREPAMVEAPSILWSKPKWDEGQVGMVHDWATLQIGQEVIHSNSNDFESVLTSQGTQSLKTFLCQPCCEKSWPHVHPHSQRFHPLHCILWLAPFPASKLKLKVDWFQQYMNQFTFTWPDIKIPQLQV